MSKLSSSDIIKIINDVKSMDNVDGRFYRSGWKDACEFIINHIKMLEDSDSATVIKDRYYGL